VVAETRRWLADPRKVQAEGGKRAKAAGSDLRELSVDILDTSAVRLGTRCFTKSIRQ
jgi:hypothetical protein